MTTTLDEHPGPDAADDAPDDLAHDTLPRDTPDVSTARSDPRNPRQVRAWATAVEVGVLARAARLDPDVGWRGDATTAELLVLEAEGRRARHDFVTANLGLVRSVVRGSTPNVELLADVFQEGCLGLLMAVDRFDHTRGVRFSTYATYWIRAFVSAALARQSAAVTIPVSRAEQLRVALGTQSALAQDLGRMPTAAEVATAIGRDRRWTADLLGHAGISSLDVLDDERLQRLSPLDPSLEGTLERDTATWVHRLLAGLTGFERRVVELRLGFDGRAPASRPAVARELGRPLGQVRRAEVRALERLRARCPEAVLGGVAS